MSDLVTKHVRQWAREPFAWGKTDCSIVLANYVLDATGIDGAAHLRGRYSTRLGCARLTGFQRGLVSVVAGCCATAGLNQTNRPVRGSVGVLDAAGRQVGALCLGRSWAFKSETGVIVTSECEIIAAWAVPGV